jgi:hypothetical protein
MRSTLIVLLATFAGIGLAWILFAPSPDAVPTAPPAPKAAVTAPAAPPPGLPPAPGAPGAPMPDPTAAHAAFQARINQPDAALAGMQSSSWTVIRRELATNGSEQAQGLVNEVSDLVRDLREARLRPDDADSAALATRQADLRKRIAAANISSPLMEEQFKRLDELNASHAQQAGKAGAPAGATEIPLGTTASGTAAPEGKD